ncbi:hypothetical protein AOC36_06055 [Erysipelothrix larvae]|uniref:Uncharacterized protein n=1 Tax=Erysipelothrix larvae TaxID=1514105 RepID=A0A0X8H015_9FIRM|nr:hypothetical protein [Erysipelothrix larvae]AMC93561.1 hypothetical protein AOC36_06055 [Erysipelothrix larvae]
MKRILPLAVIAALAGGAAYYLKRNQVKVEETLKALDDISDTAETTVNEFASELNGESGLNDIVE